jgi:hypothetical protein
MEQNFIPDYSDEIMRKYLGEEFEWKETKEEDLKQRLKVYKLIAEECLKSIIPMVTPPPPPPRRAGTEDGETVSSSLATTRRILFPPIESIAPNISEDSSPGPFHPLLLPSELPHSEADDSSKNKTLKEGFDNLKELLDGDETKPPRLMEMVILKPPGFRCLVDSESFLGKVGRDFKKEMDSAERIKQDEEHWLKCEIEEERRADSETKTCQPIPVLTSRKRTATPSAPPPQKAKWFKIMDGNISPVNTTVEQEEEIDRACLTQPYQDERKSSKIYFAVLERETSAQDSASSTSSAPLIEKDADEAVTQVAEKLAQEDKEVEMAIAEAEDEIASIEASLQNADNANDQENETAPAELVAEGALVIAEAEAGNARRVADAQREFEQDFAARRAEERRSGFYTDDDGYCFPISSQYDLL